MAQPGAYELVSAARDLTRIEHAATAGLWPRAAALLTRQALQLALSRLWEVTAPGFEYASMRPQLLCAGTFLQDPALGGRVHAAWNTLSESCHHRVYELAPTAGELQRAMETVWQLADAVERLRATIAAARAEDAKPSPA